MPSGAPGCPPHSHSRSPSEAEPLLASSGQHQQLHPHLQLVHPRQEHGDGLGSPVRSQFGEHSIFSLSASGLLGRFLGEEAGEEREGARDDDGDEGGNVARGDAVRFVWLLTVSACVSGLLFGYDTGVISATLVSVGASLSGRILTSLDKSLITSATALLGLFSSPASSILADKLGRKSVMLLADILFILGALVQAASSSVGVMILGRAIVGAAVGASSFVTPLYIAELAPAAKRGRLVTMNVLCITLGQVVAYIIGWLFSEHSGEDGGSNDAHVFKTTTGWRCMVGLGAVPAIVQCVLLLFWMPETPRWLVRAGRPEEAEKIIQKTVASGPDWQEAVRESMLAIQMEVQAEEDSAKILSHGLVGGDEADHPTRVWLIAGWTELLRVPKSRRALSIACLLQGLQQLCGFNSLMYFSATIFEMLGFTTPTLTSLTVAGTNFVFTVVALLLIDRIGRRRMLLYSVPFMVVGLLLASVGFRTVQLTDTPIGMMTYSAPVVILVSMMVFTASYALGLGNVPWMQSELFPLNVRSLGSGLATSTNWLANFVVGLTFLPLMDTLTPSWTFVLYGFVCAAGWVAIWNIYPETAGLSLEEAGDVVEQDWGVQRSVE